MKQVITRSEIEQLLSSSKKNIQRLEIELARGLATDHTNSKLYDALDSLTHLRKIVYQLNASLIILDAQEFDMNYGMYLEIEKARKIQKNLTKILTNY